MYVMTSRPKKNLMENDLKRMITISNQEEKSFEKSVNLGEFILWEEISSLKIKFNINIFIILIIYDLF